MKDNNGFKAYIDECRKYTAAIKYENLFFWGGWVCEELLVICQGIISRLLAEKEISLIKDILSYIWSVVDSNDKLSPEKSRIYLRHLNDINETDLDRTDYQENALYELIISIDAIMNFAVSKRRGFEYNLSMAVLNAIDSKLQDNDQDILTDEGFNEPIVQREIKSQTLILRLMAEKKLDSNSKKLYR